MQLLKYSILILLLSANFSCKSNKPTPEVQQRKEVEQLPTWMNKLIARILQDKPTNPPTKIYSYSYQGQDVFYITAHCCDVPSTLYDSGGQVLCLPDGGITGKGDGRCTDFHDTKTNEKLIWEDKR